MKAKAVLGCSTAFLVFSCLNCYEATITITTQPLPVNTSANRNVTFFCAAENANIFNWRLNDTDVKLANLTIDYNQATNTTEDPATSFFELCIPTQIGNLNGSLIKCEAFLYTRDSGSSSSIAAAGVNSSEALLLIQGPLEPVDDVHMTTNCETETMNISWTRPYTLEGVSIQSYNICVDGNCGVYDGDVDSVSRAIPSINVAPADKYNVCVQAYDCTIEDFAAFTCETFSPDKIVPNWIYSDDIDTKLVFLRNDSRYRAEVKVDLQVENICQVPEYFDIELTLPNGTRSSPSPVMINLTKNVTMFVVDLPSQQTHVSMTIKPTNSAGSNSSDPIMLALFHVQDVILDELEENITCEFLEGSDARGCSITLSCENRTTNSSLVDCKVFRASEDDYYATGGLCQEDHHNCTRYVVRVYDIFSDGSISRQEAIVLHNITFPDPSTPTQTPIPTSELWLSLLALVAIPLLVCVLPTFITYYCAKHAPCSLEQKRTYKVN